MTRQLRLQCVGEAYHVMARGNERRRIVRTDRDRRVLLEMLGEAVDRFRWILFAYALMPNHFHLFLRLTEESLSDGMHWLDGKYAAYFNRKYARVGHFFQDRPKVRLVDTDTYFLELLRYVALNPVYDGMVARPEDYAWSSHRAMIGAAPAPSWLAVDDALIGFAPDLHTARRLYKRFVDEGIGQPSLLAGLEDAAYLGSEEWLQSVREKVELRPRSSEYRLLDLRVGRPSISEIVTSVAETLDIDPAEVIFGRNKTARLLATWVGVTEGMLRNTEIAAGLRISGSLVTRMKEKCKAELKAGPAFQSHVDQCVSTLRRKCKNQGAAP